MELAFKLDMRWSWICFKIEYALNNETWMEFAFKLKYEIWNLAFGIGLGFKLIFNWIEIGIELNWIETEIELKLKMELKLKLKLKLNLKLKLKLILELKLYWNCNGIYIGIELNWMI